MGFFSKMNSGSPVIILVIYHFLQSEGNIPLTIHRTEEGGMSTDSKKITAERNQSLDGTGRYLFYFNKSVFETGCFDLCKHSIGVGLDAVSSNLNAV